MVVGKDVNQLVRKQDLVHIAILLVIALGIGIYLIATTTLIAKDGVSYINYAKGLAIAPLKTIRDCSEYAPRAYTPGYPFLILMTHKLVDLFGDGSSILSWIYSAQAIALFCRILALIPLYFIGKEFVGSKLSFWAILILVMLPYPARFGSDALRDWPHILFLATGFLFLLWGAKHGKWLMFAVVGLFAGLGYTVRPMCAQLVAYGVLWLIFSIFRRERKCSMSRTKLVGGLALLVIGFAVVAAPYMKIRGEILPTRLRQIMESFSSCPIDSESQEQSSGNYTAELVPGDITKAVGKLISNISENLMYYFVPALFIGMYYHFRRKPKSESIFFIAAFLLANIVIVILRYCISLELSKRYILPVITFTIFFVPLGLQIMNGWVEGMLSRKVCRNEASQKESQRWFFILLVTGLAICVPKLFRPIRVEKKAYRLAAEWLKRNTNEDSVIAVSDSDPRMAFYSERKVVLVPQRVMPQNADFAVKIYKGNTKTIDRGGAFSFDGIGDYIDVVTNPIPPSSDFSISGWVYCEGEAVGDTDRFGTAFGSGNWSGTAIEGVVIRRSADGSLRVAFGDGSEFHNLVAVSNITTTNKQKWYHTVVVRKSSKFEVYVNGESTGSVAGGYVNSGVNFRIGHSGNLNGSQAYWYGIVKNVRVYDKALSFSEVLDLYSGNNNLADSPEEYILNLGRGKRKTKLVIYRLPLIRTFSF